MAHRPGFVVPNAGDTDPYNLVSNRQAEPDAGDYWILGNNENGVLRGCSLNISSSSVSVNTADGINVVQIHRDIYPFANTSTGLQAGGSSDRFDLVAYDRDAGFRLLKGAESGSPKFLEIPANVVVLGVIWVPATVAAASITNANLVDKRKFLMNGARGAVTASTTLIENKPDGGTTTYKVLGSGSTTIGSVTLAPNVSDGLSISGGDISIESDVDITGNLIVDGYVAADGKLTGANLYSQPVVGTPSNGIGTTGSLFLDETNGRAYIKRTNNQWAEIYADEYPPGTLIASLLPGAAATEYLTGSWLICHGQSVPKDSYQRLAAAFPTWVSGNNLILPDLRDMFLMGGTTPGVVGGANSLSLAEAHMPPHKHFNTSTTGAAGAHNHTGATAAAAGGHTPQMQPGSAAHKHGITDKRHAHIGADHGLETFSWFIHTRWGGSNKLDAHFSDASHTWTVDVTDRTNPAYTGINATNLDGAHDHPMLPVGDHIHNLSIPEQQPHTHPMPTEATVGSGQAFENRPRFHTVNYYIKA